jgi:hypothetical protein
MKLVDVRKAYYEFSGTVSKIARTLALSGIAVIWVFKTDSVDRPHLPRELVLTTFLLVAALALDLMHYVTAIVVWGTYHRVKERQHTTEATEFEVPRWFNWPTTFFLFPSKVIALAAAYVFLLSFYGIDYGNRPPITLAKVDTSDRLATSTRYRGAKTSRPAVERAGPSRSFRSGHPLCQLS